MNVTKRLIRLFDKIKTAKCIGGGIVAAAAGITWFSTVTNFNFYGDWEGLYLMKGESGYRYEVTDDLFPDGVHRLIVQIPTGWLARCFSVARSCTASVGNCMQYEWNEKAGRGFILNRFGDGSRLLMCFSRFKDDSGLTPSGIFIGGGLPEYEEENPAVKLNETGMAFYDGKQWFHIWCSVNEAIASGVNPQHIYFPSQWKYLRSRVLEQGAHHITLSSTHELTVEGVPLQVNKYLFYRTGDHYFTLVTQLTNIGTKPTSFYYTYGDEPWLGNYGTSGGNIGWTNGRLVTHEGEIDTKTTSYVGMFDYGNNAIREGHDFTGRANFIEWRDDSRPDMVYFSNTVAGFSSKTPENVPLASPTSRFVGLQWGPRVLKPGQATSFTFAVGMAETNPITGFPVSPRTTINN